jgi:hypothetical protein
VQCEYCGNQRSVRASKSGAVIEEHVLDLLNFEKSEHFNDKQKAVLAYAEAITWHLQTDDAFWDRLHKHFSEPELVEIGCMIGLTLGQQSWLRLLNIDHHQVLEGTDASMAPGYETAECLKYTKSSAVSWAKSKPATGSHAGCKRARSMQTDPRSKRKRSEIDRSMTPDAAASARPAPHAPSAAIAAEGSSAHVSITPQAFVETELM